MLRNKSNIMFNSCNRPNVVNVMSDNAELELGFKIGVLKELRRRQLITKDELEQAIKAINGNI